MLLLKLLSSLFIALIFTNIIFSQEENWVLISDTLLSEQKKDDSTIIPPKVLNVYVCSGKDYIVQLPLNEKKVWITTELEWLDFDIFTKISVMFRINLKCFLSEYYILQSWKYSISKGWKELYNDIGLKGQLAALMTKGKIKEKVLNYICNLE